MYREIELPSSIVVVKPRIVVFDDKGMGVFVTDSLMGAQLSCDGHASLNPGVKYTAINVNGGAEVYACTATLN